MPWKDCAVEVMAPFGVRPEESFQEVTAVALLCWAGELDGTLEKLVAQAPVPIRCSHDCHSSIKECDFFDNSKIEGLRKPRGGGGGCRSTRDISKIERRKKYKSRKKKQVK